MGKIVGPILDGYGVGLLLYASQRYRECNKIIAIFIKKGDTIFFEIKGKSDKGITELWKIREGIWKNPLLKST